MSSRPLRTLLLAATLSAAPLAAQTADPALLSVERIWSSPELFPASFGPARWLRDGSAYTTLESDSGARGGQDIVRYDAASGRRAILIPAARLVPPGDSAPLAIEGYEWSPDGGAVLVFTNSRRVWRQNTRGDYWLLDRTTWRLRKLGGDARPSTLMFAKFSPDGGRVGYVRENNLYVEDLASAHITQLTADGSRTTINGTFDWVYEEELDLRDGFRWSPDGQSLAYWQLDASGVRDFLLINNTDSLYSYVVPVQYPKAGTVNSASRIGVVSAAGGPTRWLAIPGDPRNNYIARMDWAANSREVIIQRLNRLQNTNEVMLGAAASGQVRTILTERDSAWLDVVNDVRWLEAGKRFTWVSERDGWRHVYTVTRDGRGVRLITPGDFDVVSVERIDEPGGWMYYIASPENPAQRYLFRTRLDGIGKAERLTPASLAGTNTYDLAPDARWAFHVHSRSNLPPVTDLVALPRHQVVRTLVANAELRARVAALRQRAPEFFRIDIGAGITVDGWMMKPVDFDSTARYPLLFHVYGEPAAQTVLDEWGGPDFLWHLMLTQQGYLVASIDNRGTPAPRGRAWRKAIYRQVGIINSEDQANAARAIMRTRAYVDSTRIGVWGWSGGGSMSLNLIFRYPEIYRTAMSVAPVSDERYYDTIYQERYMGLPDENKDGYRLGSPITFASRLRGNLLLVHGSGDDNVHYQNSEALINALIRANKPFTMMEYPNRSHGIFEGPNTRRHLYELLTRYLHEHLAAGAIRR